MSKGIYCRGMSATVDEHINRRMGTMSAEDFIAHLMYDAENSEQMSALSFQFLCVGRRIKTLASERRRSGSIDLFSDSIAKIWKKAADDAAQASQKIVSRVGAVDKLLMTPSIARCAIGRPGMLYSDVVIPKYCTTAFDSETVGVGVYVTPLKNNTQYQLTTTPRLDVFFKTKDDTGFGSKVPGSLVKAFVGLGQLIPIKAFDD